MLISTRCIHGFISNLIKKSWTDSSQCPLINYIACYEVEDEDDPTREAIIAMVEKDVAFSDVDNRRLLMGFIKKVCQAEKFL